MLHRQRPPFVPHSRITDPFRPPPGVFKQISSFFLPLPTEFLYSISQESPLDSYEFVLFSPKNTSFPGLFCSPSLPLNILRSIPWSRDVAAATSFSVTFFSPPLYRMLWVYSRRGMSTMVFPFSFFLFPPFFFFSSCLIIFLLPDSEVVLVF